MSTEPRTYSALICRHAGPPDQVTVIAEMPRRPLAPDELRLRVEAAGVNHADLMQITGAYQLPPPHPFVPGFEVAGTVLELGAEVTGWHVGQAAIAAVVGGAYATEVIIRAEQAVALPSEAVRRISIAQAATVPIAYGTAHLALVQRAKLERGEQVVVLGATGAVGDAALQIARMLGAKVTAVVRSKADEHELAARGFTALIIGDPDTASLDDVSADVVIDTVGGEIAEALFARLAPEGRLVVVGIASGMPPTFAARGLLTGNSAALGLDLSAYVIAKPEVVKAALEQVVGWIADGSIAPLKPRVEGLSQAPAILAAVHRGERLGKVAILTDVETVG